jgi:hypothetical protein
MPLIDPTKAFEEPAMPRQVDAIPKVSRSRKLIDPTKLTPTSGLTEPREVVHLKREIDSIKDTKDFSASPLVQYFHAVEYENITIDLKTALQLNLAQLIDPEIQHCLKTNQNMNWSIFGRPGSGKSIAGLGFYGKICRQTGVSLKTRNMFTNGTDLYRKLHSLFETTLGKQDLCKNDVIFCDENINDKTGMGAFHLMTQNTEMEVRIRAKMIHFIWVSTILYPHQSTLVMETYDVKRVPENVEYLERIRLLCYNANNKLMGCLIMHAPHQDIIKAYLKHIKNESIKTYFSGSLDPRARMLREISQECLNDIAFVTLINKEQRQQFIDENYGYLALTLGQQNRILGLTKLDKDARHELLTKLQKGQPDNRLVKNFPKEEEVILEVKKEEVVEVKKDDRYSD